jgi:hypothetical protein
MLNKSVGDHLAAEGVQFMSLYARCAFPYRGSMILDSQTGNSTARRFLLCHPFLVRDPGPLFPLISLTLTIERAPADWEYFTIASYIKPHLVSDGQGTYELIVTVGFWGFLFYCD